MILLRNLLKRWQRSKRRSSSTSCNQLTSKTTKLNGAKRNLLAKKPCRGSSRTSSNRGLKCRNTQGLCKGKWQRTMGNQKCARIHFLWRTLTLEKTSSSKHCSTVGVSRMSTKLAGTRWLSSNSYTLMNSIKRWWCMGSQLTKTGLRKLRTSLFKTGPWSKRLSSRLSLPQIRGSAKCYITRTSLSTTYWWKVLNNVFFYIKENRLHVIEPFSRYNKLKATSLKNVFRDLFPRLLTNPMEVSSLGTKTIGFKTVKSLRLTLPPSSRFTISALRASTKLPCLCCSSVRWPVVFRQSAPRRFQRLRCSTRQINQSFRSQKRLTVSLRPTESKPQLSDKSLWRLLWRLL